MIKVMQHKLKQKGSKSQDINIKAKVPNQHTVLIKSCSYIFKAKMNI